MVSPFSFRWRKTSDVKREHAVFELLEGDTPILDLGFSDDDVLEVAFSPSIGSKIIELNQLLELFSEGKALAEDDMNESKSPDWVSRGKTIRQLIKKLQTFEDPEMEVRISLDDGETHRAINLVEKSGLYCLLVNSEFDVR